MRNILRTLTLLVMAALLGACSSSENLEKPSPLVNFVPKIQVEKLWRQSVGGSDKKYLNLQIGHDQKTIYTVGYYGRVYADDAQNGNEIWHRALHANIISGVSVGDQLAIVGDNVGNMIALNTQNGKIVWQHNVGNQVLGLAAIGNGVVVVKTVADNVVVLNAQNGEELWHFSGNAPTLILRGGSQPKIVGNKLIIGFADGKLREFNLHKGTLLWQQVIAQPQGGFPIQRLVDITASPVISHGVTYVVTYQGNIQALETGTGQMLWHHKLSSYTGMALSSTNLYVTDAKSHIYSFSQEDGNVVWKQIKLEARTITAPVLLGDYLIVADAEGYLHWLSQASGEFVAREQASGDAIRSTPVVIDDRVYVLDTHGNLAAYKLVK